MNPEQNIARIRKEITEKNVKLITVTKLRNLESIMKVYEAGERAFGENKVQELTDKYGQLPEDIEWHFIGHLQRNKVKYIAAFIHAIHSVDSPRLLREINKQAQKHDRVIQCFLQLHIADESSKYGFSEDGLMSFLSENEWQTMKHVRIIGLMGMATFTDDTTKVRSEFRSLSETFKKVKNAHFSDEPAFREISMGMSNDYQVAIEEGSTMIRLGSTIFEG